MITPRMKRRIKRELSSEKPTICVGKGGVAQQNIDEIDRQLEEKKMVKVKILKSAIKNESAVNIASKIAQETASTLIEVRGHTFMLYKPRKKKQRKKK